MFTEYRTKQLNRETLLEELAFVCDELSRLDVTEAAVSFGWDSNLPIDEMWKEQVVPIREVVAYVEGAERAGTLKVGAADIFVESDSLRFTLCHESDAHVRGSLPLTEELLQRWGKLGYEPYAVESGA